MKAALDMLTRNRKVQALLLVLVTVAAVDAGFYFRRAAPAAREAKALEARLRENRAAIKAMNDEYRLYVSFERERGELKKFKELLPARSDYTKIITKVMGMAKDDGMKSASFGTVKKDIEQEGSLVQLNFSMPVSGSYKSVRKFIHDVETSPLFLNIDNLVLSTDAETGEVSVTLALSTY